MRLSRLRSWGVLRGSLETADVTLMGDALEGIPFGVSGIGAAVLVHEGSTLVVVANALRLLRYGR